MTENYYPLRRNKAHVNSPFGTGVNVNSSDIFASDSEAKATCRECGQPEGQCYNLCPNSPAYYSPERERQDDLMDDGSDDHRERYAATAEPSQYEEPEDPAREQQRRATRRELNGASQKQIDYINSLLDRNLIPAEAADGIRQQIAEGKVDKDRASRYLDKLIPLDKAARAERRDLDQRHASVKELEVGMYRTTQGQVIRVYLGQKSGKNLVKVYDEANGEYTYVGAVDGKARHLCADAKPMTLDEAKAFGRMSGFCGCCGRRLDVPESVEAGIGPVCAAKFN